MEQFDVKVVKCEYSHNVWSSDDLLGKIRSAGNKQHVEQRWITNHLQLCRQALLLNPADELLPQLNRSAAQKSKAFGATQPAQVRERWLIKHDYDTNHT